MQRTNTTSYSIKISPEADINVMQLQLILAKKLGKKITKKKVIDSALAALMHRVGMIVEGSKEDE